MERPILDVASVVNEVSTLVRCTKTRSCKIFAAPFRFTIGGSVCCSDRWQDWKSASLLEY